MHDGKEVVKTLSANPVVFVASMPDAQGKESDGLIAASKIENILILHPCYDFTSEIGKKTLNILEWDIPQHTNMWENMMRRDFFCIQKSDLVIIDLDAITETHFLAIAAWCNKPIIAVSSTLVSVPAYFSGSVTCIVKPDQLENILNCFSFSGKKTSLVNESV